MLEVTHNTVGKMKQLTHEILYSRTHLAGVQSRGWLKEKNVRLLVGDRPMFDATGHHQEFALFEPDVPIPEFHAEAALHHQEQFVLLVVVMPDERPPGA
jgi:hypothetical protein